MKCLSACLLILTIFTSCSSNKKEADPWIASAPAGERFVSIDQSGETVIPNGRLLTPSGKSIVVAPHPYGLTLSPDGNTAVTANSGTSPLSITIIRNILSGACDEHLRDLKKQIPELASAFEVDDLLRGGG